MGEELGRLLGQGIDDEIEGLQGLGHAASLLEELGLGEERHLMEQMVACVNGKLDQVFCIG